MENNEIYKKEAVWLNCRHFGIIISNLAIFCAVMTILIPISTILGFLTVGAGYLILFALTVFLTLLTVGTIWATGAIQKMWNWVQSAGENQMMFSEFIIKFLPYFAIAGALLGFASAIVLQFIKQDKRTGRIITGYIFGTLCLIICILSFAGVFIKYE